MNRRTFVRAMAAAPAVIASAARRPNLVWLMADDMGFGEVGCYGQKFIRTPNIDKLAVEGTLWRTSYAGCTVCAPSRSTLMTGLHTGHTPIRSNPGGVPILPGETTVADVLHASGYATGLFGKWGLGDINTEGVPWKHGFDEFFGPLHQAHAHFQYPRFLYNNDKEFHLPGNSDTTRVTYGQDVMADRAIDFISRRKDRPFFLYYSPTIPHFEPHVPEDSMAEYRGKFPMGKPYRNANDRLKAQPDLRTAYAGMVTRLDSYVGRIMARIRELNLDRDTIVFFTSDNGATLPGIDNFFDSAPGCRGHKGNLYEGGLRVPMIARCPGRVPVGRKSDFIWYFPDFFPTAAEFAGASGVPKNLDGISVAAEITGKKQQGHETFYWEHPQYNNKAQEFVPGLPMQAIRKGTLKAIRPKTNAKVELYDLAADPGETKDLADAKPELAAQFDRLLQTSRVPPRAQKEPPHPWWEARS
jgi:arylsulfatase A-like enzyme